MFPIKGSGLKLLLLIALFSVKGLVVYCQYSPAGGEPGSDAIYKNDNRFKEWASTCTVQRGYIEINDTSLTTTEGAITSNRAFFGTPENAIGTPQGMLNVVSLGDRGSAIVTFETAISDGDGPDFAVFENGFVETTPPYLYFLELGFVEVSTDGQRYVRFPAISLTQTDTQIGSFGQLDPTKLYNLAGKYTADYGTPFDLQELADSSGIDIHNIQYVRIVDVVGSIDSLYGSRDSKGNMINDPFPTPFWDGGFDLQAVGVINMVGATTSLNTKYENNWKLYPNPVCKGASFFLQSSSEVNEKIHLQIMNMTGKVVFESYNFISSSGYQVILPSGMYIVTIQDSTVFFKDQLLVIQ